MTEMIRILGIDPGLQRTGWGIIAVQGWKTSHIGSGVISSDAKKPLSTRLMHLYTHLQTILTQYTPQHAAIETSFVQKNAQTALKLGHARAAAMLAIEHEHIPLSEYAPRMIKKAVVGTGKAEKEQIAHMIGILLPGCMIQAGDAADALATALCHAHTMIHTHSVYRSEPAEDQKKQKGFSHDCQIKRKN